MRKRFWKKQWIAVAMASSLIVSGVSVPAKETVVQAAENVNVLYSNAAKAETGELKLPEEDWGDNKPIIAYDESIKDIKITKNFTMTADVYLDEAGYKSLAEAGDYIKLQGVVKLGEAWDWNDSQDIPYLEQKNFEKTEQGYKTSVTIEFKDKTPDVLKGIYFVIVAKGFEGKVTFTNVALAGKQEQQITEKKDALAVSDFEADAAGTNAGWEKESGWQYEKDVTAEVEKAFESNMLKLGLDYTGCEGYTWSEAKIKKVFKDGLDVSAYNLLTLDIIYPEAFGGFKTKIFAKEDSSGTEIINKEGISEVSDLGNGMKKAVITVSFSPNTAKITELVIGIVGVSTSFKGNVYMDNVVLSQYNEASDFVDITSVPGTGTKADTSAMSGEVSLADSQAKDSVKALYSYLAALDKADQVLFGHQNDTHKHVTSREGVYSDTKDITGSISGLVGIDSLSLTGVESGFTDTEKAIEYCVKTGKEAAAEGAILTLSVHMPNMSNEKITATPGAKRKYDFSKCDFSESQDLSNNCAQEVMPGGKYNAQFTTYLDIIADYAKGLGDIPVLFRPFHENDGGWFWWGSATTSQETYKAMYRYAQDYLKAAGVHNFIYVYSPNGPVQSEEKYNERYPGDAYIDVLAFDYYDDMTYADTYGDTFLNNLRSSCEIIKKMADDKGKLAAISEAGVRITREDGTSNGGLMVKKNPIKGINWYSQVNKVARETGMPYFLIWANFSDTNFYLPYKYSDTKGQELVNEFIDFYNESSSVFANGTSFYGDAEKKQVTNKDQKIKSGYFANLFPMSAIKDAFTLKASVQNAAEVKFVLKAGTTEKEIAAVKAESGYYEAEVTKETLDLLGKTDIGTVSIVADSVDILTLSNISFGKEKDVLAKHEIENFELYYGDNDYLNGYFTENSGAGAASSFVLDGTNKSNGTYGGAFTYKLETDGAETYTGRMKGLPETDYSGYNALSMWVKPDGKGQKLVIQLTSDGEDFEVFLTDFVKTENAKYVTIPFSKMKGKSNGTFNASNITKFAIYCNSIGKVNINSQIVFDDIQFTKVNESSLSYEEGGYALTDSLADNSTDKDSLAKVNGLKASKNTAKAVTLSWNVTEGAEGYQVYRYNSASKDYKLVKSVTGTSYTDKKLKAGTIYQYKVCAYKTENGKTVNGTFSDVLKTASAPAKVSGVKVNKSGKVTWKKVSGASGYEVYFAKNNNKKFKKAASVNGAGKTSYTVKKAEKGTYKVRAYKTVDGKKIKGAFSAGKKLK